MTSPTPWQRFLTRSTRGLDNAEVARRTGVSAATITRWHKRGTESAETVILLARTFGDDPKLALVETGHLTMAEATRENYADDELLARFDELDLAREIVRRLEGGEAGDALADEGPSPYIPTIVPGSGHDDEPEIPMNVEDAWGNAAHDDTPEPEDHTP